MSDALYFTVRNIIQTPELVQEIPINTIRNLILSSKYIMDNIKNEYPFQLLRQHQRLHCLKMLKILKTYSRGIDTSLMGTGKTAVGCILFKLLGLKKLVVFGPAIVENVWRNLLKHFKINDQLFEFHAYTEMRKKKKPYLTIENDKINIDPEFTEKVEEGIFLVFDESHHLKNESQQSLYLTALSQHLLERKSKSKLLCLSATPFDKKENCVRMNRILNIIRQSELAQSVFGNYKLTGYQDLLDFCKKYKLTVPLEHVNITGNAQKSVNEVWRSVIVPHMCAAMPLPSENNKIKIECKNAFIDVKAKEDIEKIEKGVRQITGALAAYAVAQTQNIQNIADISKGMKTIEKGKANTFAECVIRSLKENGKSKVIILCNYIKPITKLCGLLAEYKPLVITGETPLTKRIKYIEWFQEANTKYRLIIANLSLMKEGISLDDRDGRFPRIMYVSPSYYLIAQHQATHRIYRGDQTKSDAKVYFVYANQCKQEPKLLSKLAEKSEILSGNLEYKVLLPGQYETVTF